MQTKELKNYVLKIIYLLEPVIPSKNSVRDGLIREQVGLLGILLSSLFFPAISMGSEIQ